MPKQMKRDKTGNTADEMTPDDLIRLSTVTPALERQQECRWSKAREDKRLTTHPCNESENSKQKSRIETGFNLQSHTDLSALFIHITLFRRIADNCCMYFYSLSMRTVNRLGAKWFERAEISRYHETT